MFIDVASLPTDPLVGTRYRTAFRIGGGSFSDVYEARSPNGERVAVKILHIHHRDSQEYAARFLQEGRVLASLSHPNLVPLREIGVTRDGRPFLVMPRLEGHTLRTALDVRGPLAPHAAVGFLAGALDGLHAAHKQGVVHRDVKPCNVFLAVPPDGGPIRAMMLDFGIAKVAGAAAHHTTSSRVLGTPKYLAPEQILGGRVDARTDVYSMGIVLFEALAARGPFDLVAGADFTTLLRAHLALPPRRLDELAHVPSSLARVVARALEKPPAKRYPSAAAFAAALRRTLKPAAAMLELSAEGRAA